jgi:argininosuccinate lyase
MDLANNRITGIFSLGHSNELTKRIDDVHDRWILWRDTAWFIMLAKQKIIPEKHLSDIVKTVRELYADRENKYTNERFGIENYAISKLGTERAGFLSMGRTVPSQDQQFVARHKLMKLMCMFYDFQKSLLNFASEHHETVMPGYTHFRQAQPTTLGHYLLSVFDPIERILKTVEDSYIAMSLNELGCGALAGTSLPIDRHMVSKYLGLEGLIENTNDAVAYTDGYVLLVSSLANIMAVVSRLALDLNIWSTLEYGFCEVPLSVECVNGTSVAVKKGGASRSTSFFMPNKAGKGMNSPALEQTRAGAAQVAGLLTETVAMGMRTSHADMHEMLHMLDSTGRAIDKTLEFMNIYIHLFKHITVFKDRMLEMARTGYSCATELSNVLVINYDIDSRTAHHIINGFCIESDEKDIPSGKANLAIFDKYYEEVTGHKSGMSEAELRKALDPVNFIHTHKTQGGVSPDETKRMLNERTKRLEEYLTRHKSRIKKLEDAKKRTLSDLESL